MIENANVSKNPSTGNFDYKKYVGVASVNVVAVNPDNATLRKFGYEIAEDADEPAYTATREVDGRTIKSARIRLLVQLQDIEDKPVISLDFWVRPEVMTNREGTKCKIIDQYGRTAWATKEEFQNNEVPTYANGNKANISTPYRMCHHGEEELVSFLLKYLNVTPLQVFDRARNGWIDSKNPGKLTIDDWKGLCEANVKEIKTYLATQPENRVKVILGIRSTDDNRTYQTFLNTGFIGNGSRIDLGTGEYASARKLIDRYFEGREDSQYQFSASSVKEWKEMATKVEESSSDSIFSDSTGFAPADDDPSNDLPF